MPQSLIMKTFCRLLVSVLEIKAENNQNEKNRLNKTSRHAVNITDMDPFQAQKGQSIQE